MDPNVKTRYEGALKKQRELNTFVLPEGVDRANALRMWEDIDFGGTGTKPSIRSDEDLQRFQKMFVPAYPLIRQTREIAEARRRGRFSPPLASPPVEVDSETTHGFHPLPHLRETADDGRAPPLQADDGDDYPVTKPDPSGPGNNFVSIAKNLLSRFP